MAPPVYSERILVGRNGPGLLEYTVPSGLRVIVRDIDLWVTVDLVSPNVITRFLGSAGQTIWWYETSSGSTSSPQWRGRQVFDEGETIGFLLPSGDVTMSGYVLTLP